MSRADKPAYPGKTLTGLAADVHKFNGMSIREYYAGLAMQGLCANGSGANMCERAEAAVIGADALLAELAKVTP